MGALDGLRGVSLIAVLCYHGGFSWARGGFLGVSTFFTLSGFLITSLLLVERKDSGTVSLRGFWTARVRRLLPAALVTLVLVIAFARFAASPTQLTGLRGDLLSCFGLVTNWRLAVAGRAYGAYITSSSPVQHIWSLAVEEQFYIVLPLLVLAATYRSKRPQVRVGVLAALLAAASTYALVTAVGSDGDTTWAYYATYTRAAELLAGVVLACLAPRISTWTQRGTVARKLGAIGAVGLVLMWWRADQTATWLYRGGLSAYTLGSVFVILAALHRGPIRTALEQPLLQWVGRLSYSAYLYHWPIFLWLTEGRLGIGGVALFALRVAFTIWAAAVSTAFLEKPIRARRLLPRLTPGPVIGVVVAALLLVVIVPGHVVDNGPSGVAVAAGRRVDAAAGSVPHPATATGDHTGTVPRKAALHRLLLVGDSIMHQASPYFAERYPKVDVRWVGGDGIGPLSDQGRIVRQVKQAVAEVDPDVVVIEFAGSYLKRMQGKPFVTAGGREVPDGSDLMFQLWEQKSRKLVEEARARGATVLWALTPAIDPNGFFQYLAPNVDRFNAMYFRLPGATTVDWYDTTVDSKGRFTTRLTNAQGANDIARQPDGLHFTAFGYRLLVNVAALSIDAYHGRRRTSS